MTHSQRYRPAPSCIRCGLSARWHNDCRWRFQENNENKLLPGTSAGLMPTEARGNYVPEPPYLRETKTYHNQPLESIRHAGNYFVPISVRPIFISLLRKLCQITWLLTGWKKCLYFRRPPWGLRSVAFATSATWLIRHWPVLVEVF